MANAHNISVNNSHPKALWALSLIYATFTLSFGIFLANLAIFLKSQAGMTDDQSFQITAAFISLSFTTPLLGGFLCDKFGFRNAVTVGLGLSFIGMMCIIIPGNLTLFLGLAIFLAGNALCTPAIWSLIGMLYHKNDARRESGSTFFYMLFNIGFLTSNFFSGFVIAKIGYYYTFLIFGSPLLIGFLAFLIFRSRFRTYRETEEGELMNQGNITVNIISLIAISILLVPLYYMLLNYAEINGIILWIVVLASFAYLFIVSRKLPKAQANKLIAFIILCIVAMAYFIVFASEFGLLPIFAQGNIDRLILGVQVSGGIITSLDPAYCILIGFIYTAMWVKLDKLNKNPSLPTKFALGLILASIGYLILSLLIKTYISSMFSMLWLLLVFGFFVAGELLVVPMGISMAGQLSPEGKEGFCMGVWNLMSGAGAVLMGYMAFFTVVPSTDTITQSNTQYMTVFATVGVIIFLLGIVMFLCRGFIKRLL
ncbi:MAG: POT family proton-dependent oligopeptide transporter [Francisellaceae bacterium]|jgi:POT family proton-dependent oligopeptide transporter